jgi:hypothetical protein
LGNWQHRPSTPNWRRDTYNLYTTITRFIAMSETTGNYRGNGEVTDYDTENDEANGTNLHGAAPNEPSDGMPPPPSPPPPPPRLPNGIIVDSKNTLDSHSLAAVSGAATTDSHVTPEHGSASATTTGALPRGGAWPIVGHHGSALSNDIQRGSHGAGGGASLGAAHAWTVDHANSTRHSSGNIDASFYKQFHGDSDVEAQTPKVDMLANNEVSLGSSTASNVSSSEVNNSKATTKEQSRLHTTYTLKCPNLHHRS